MSDNIVKTDPHIFMAKASKTNANIAAEMADDIKEVIFRYDGTIPLALVVGVLRIVEREIIDSA